MMRSAVTTSDPRATDVGEQVLREGGNAVDAAVAAACVLFVTEPHHCGPGGDAFLLVHAPEWSRPRALDGAGAVPQALTPERLAVDGLNTVSAFGGPSVTVPGALGLLEAGVEQFGTQSLRQLVRPATVLAEGGFRVRRTLAEASEGACSRLVEDSVLGPLYAPEGQALQQGQELVNPALGSFLHRFSEDGAAALYTGEVADEVAETTARAGGYVTAEDLVAHETVEVEPASTPFRGHRVWQLPSPTQGPAVLGALERLEAGGDLGWSTVASAVTAGLRDAGVDLVDGPLASLARSADTTYLATVDRWGLAVSLITSVFAPFGSGVGVASLGGALHNRAAGFLVTGDTPRPGKPPHTIIPGLATSGSEPAVVLGVAGGLMQAQGQVQLLVRLLADEQEPQTAVDAPRFRVLPGGELALEPGHPLAETDPEALSRPPGDGGFGGAQVVTRAGDGVLAGADPRRDGAATVIDHSVPGSQSSIR